MRQREVPSAWKVATVIPIFKSGNKTEMANYRPISILPIISKVAEKWVANQIIKHLDKGYTPLHPMQFGFRAHHSTETANCVFIEKVKCLLDRNPCVGAVFLDLKKAFDTVNHQIILSKLTYFNFSIETIQWLKSYLTDRKQCVYVDGVKSPYLNSPVGVPQGSILGPILFSLYINDLPDVCPNINVQMYADDAVLFIHGKNTEETSSVLTSAMTKVQDWLSNSCLMLNTKKTVCMTFSKRPVNVKQSGVFLGGEELELVTQFKYLGVILDSSLTFKNHVKKVSNTIKFNLQNFKQIRPFMTFDAAKAYLHCMILSHIEYCFTNWSFAGITILKPIEQLFKRAIKVLERKPYSHHHCNILAKHSFLSFDNFKVFKHVCLIYKSLHGLCPPPLGEFIKRMDSKIGTRSATRGDCEVQHRRTTFGQNVLSIKGSRSWNNLPTSIRECPTFVTFKNSLKQWLKDNQTCDHF